MSIVSDILKNFKEDLKYIVENFKEECKKLRTGRANSVMVEDVLVEIQGSKMPIKSLSSISVVGPKKLSLQPWDSSYIKPIEKALQQKAIGLVQVQGNVIYVSLPELTQEYRQQLIKELKRIKEEFREKIRRERDEIWSDIQEKEKNKEISENDKFKAKEEIQEAVDDANKKLEETFSLKENEILSV